MSDIARVAAVIPARYGSTRFPGKPLVSIAGKSMIERVYEATAACAGIDEVLVATDDQRIIDAVEAFGGKAVMTSNDHQTGTDRIAEAVQDVEADLIINVQGDEPLLPTFVLDDLVAAMRNSDAEMGTLAVPFSLAEKDPDDPNAVKAVVGANGYALYFSRARVPFVRTGGTPVEPLLHWGIYAYRREFLYQYIQWERTPLETCEMLEQLRALENGARILVVKTTAQSAGVDVPEDVERVESLLARMAEGKA
jgi:3-deoxy-manno-octulosonate cytidylyltransferase (CMP-KDO synthetase)